MNQLLASILLTLITPVQLVMMLVGSLGLSAYGKHLDSTPQRYWWVELQEITDRIEFCNEWYPAGHPERVKAQRRLQPHIREGYLAKGFTAEDMEDFVTLNVISEADRVRLTAKR